MQRTISSSSTRAARASTRTSSRSSWTACMSHRTRTNATSNLAGHVEDGRRSSSKNDADAKVRRPRLQRRIGRDPAPIVEIAVGVQLVFPSPDPTEVVDVPLSSPHAGQYGDLPGSSPPPATPSHSSRRSTPSMSTWRPGLDHALPRRPPLFVCDGVDDEREINDAIAIAQGGIVELSTATSAAHGRITLPTTPRSRGQGSLDDHRSRSRRSRRVGLPADHDRGRVHQHRGLHHARERLRHGHEEPCARPGHPRDLHRPRRELAQGLGERDVLRLGGAARRRDRRRRVLRVPRRLVPHARLQHEPGLQRRRRSAPPRTSGSSSAAPCSVVTASPAIQASRTPRSRRRTSPVRSGSPASTSTSGRTSSTCEVVNCVASNNWESGFHLEPGARYGDNGENIGPRTVSKNIVFRDCVSSNNGSGTPTPATSSCRATTSRATRTSRTAHP